MRSKLSTNNRFIAHMAAVILLILMLVYLTNPAQKDTAGAAPLPIPAKPRPAAPTPEAIPVTPASPVVQTPTEAPAAPAMPAEEEKLPDADPEPAPAEPAGEEDKATSDKEPPDGGEPPPAGDGEETGIIQQPDESGSLVVAPSETGASSQVIEPLANANLEVLGDGVYWLSSRHDLAKELAAIPEIETLIILAPLPDYRPRGLEHIHTEVIPADAGDLDEDAAERFVYLASGRTGPVVAAALPGSAGAAFFKGAYLLANRKAGIDDILVDLKPELDDAGPDADEIVHRLRGLAARNPGR